MVIFLDIILCIFIPPILTIILQAIIHKRRNPEVFYLYGTSIVLSLFIYFVAMTLIEGKEIYKIVKIIGEGKYTEYIIITLVVSALVGLPSFKWEEERTVFETSFNQYVLYYLIFLLISGNFFMLSQFGVIHFAQVLSVVSDSGNKEDAIFVYIFLDLCVFKTILFTIVWVNLVHNIPDSFSLNYISKAEIPICKPAFMAVVGLFTLYTFYDQTCFKELFALNDKFIEKNYIFPSNVSITWPEKKRNLLFIFLESMESSFASKEYNGFFDENMIPQLTKLALDPENVHFSDKASLGGGIPTALAAWSVAGAFSMMAGLPYKAGPDYKSTVFPDATSVMSMLKKHGYDMYELQTWGDTYRFGNLFKEHAPGIDFYEKDRIFKMHPEFEINRSLNYAKAVSDEQMFQMVDELLKKRIDDNKLDTPFGLFMTTGSTHYPDGFPSAKCVRKHEYRYFDAMQCSDEIVVNFLKKFKSSPHYNRTTIVLVGDHISSSGTLKKAMEEYPRRIFNLIVNSPIKPVPGASRNRQFLAFDWFPTILAALNVKIEGERLALGTNLFSGQKTLGEQYTCEYVNEKVLKPSDFFGDQFGGMKANEINLTSKLSWRE